MHPSRSLHTYIPDLPCIRSMEPYAAPPPLRGSPQWRPSGFDLRFSKELGPGPRPPVISSRPLIAGSSLPHCPCPHTRNVNASSLPVLHRRRRTSHPQAGGGSLHNDAPPSRPFRPGKATYVCTPLPRETAQRHRRDRMGRMQNQLSTERAAQRVPNPTSLPASVMDRQLPASCILHLASCMLSSRTGAPAATQLPCLRPDSRGRTTPSCERQCVFALCCSKRKASRCCASRHRRPRHLTCPVTSCLVQFG